MGGENADNVKAYLTSRLGIDVTLAFYIGPTQRVQTR